MPLKINYQKKNTKGNIYYRCGIMTELLIQRRQHKVPFA